ncbi:glycoside hydrolase, partial [Rhizodiscina lignyota]
YWWEGGAAWGGLIDYWAYTKDTSYVKTVTAAIAAQVGPAKNFIVPNHADQEGNDDQAFWVCSALSGLELNHPAPSGMSWLSLATAGFENMASRWNTSTCNGGLAWQIYATNVNGLGYKNTIANAGLFQIAARLARYTGDQQYVGWANKAWDWMEGIGLISAEFNAYDGTDDTKNCSKVDGMVEWTYNNGMLMYGAAAMHSLTGESIWQDRVLGLLKMAEQRFFSPFPNATNVLFEAACETIGTCNTDQLSFKGYLSRWMAKTAMVMPEIADTVTKLLQASAKAAAQSCSGGSDGATCGNKWYVKGWDGTWGVGQQLTAMETIQALLVAQ